MNMEQSKTETRKTKRGVVILIRVSICFLIISLGGFGMVQLSASKQTLPDRVVQEKAIRVTTSKAVFQDKQVMIEGFGEVNPLNVLTLSPEVSGRVEMIHPNLEEGETVKQGDILFTLDSRDYKLSLTRSEISVRQHENKINQLEVSRKNDEKRISLLERNVALSKKEFERLNTLFTNSRIGTLSDVEKAEQSYINLLDSHDKLKSSVSLYPLQTDETRLLLNAALADRDTARLNVERCTVKAPFDGRIKSVSIEKNLYMNKGASALTLADDSILEIQVPLRFEQVYKWLDVSSALEPKNWFPDVIQKTAFVEMRERDSIISTKASINRIVRYDSASRTVTLSLRLNEDSSQLSSVYPVTDGMYCNVIIPGQVLENIVSLPEQAVNSEGFVYLSDNNRLKTIDVTIVKKEKGFVYISNGLKEGDLVITSKLNNPIENSLVVSDPAQIGKDQNQLAARVK